MSESTAGGEKKSAGRHTGIPVVFASRGYLDDADTVRPDSMQAALTDAGTLFVRGHRRIARLGGTKRIFNPRGA